jgi:integrase
MKHDLIVRNVDAAEQPPKVEGEEIVVLDGDQVRLMVERLRGRAMYPKAITALFTGLRRGELLALRWSNVDLESADRHIKVREAIEETRAGGLRFKAPKTTNGERDVSLPDIVVEALRDYRRQQLEVRFALGLGEASG